MNELNDYPYSNGGLEQSRVNAFLKLFSAIGFDKNEAYSFIHRVVTGGDNFAVIEKQSSAVEYNITKEDDEPATKLVKKVLLNKKKLSAIEKETQQAQSMLSTVFEDDVQENITQTSLANNAILEILRELLSKEIWERQDVEKICSSKGLMLGAVMEQINDYAYEKVEDVIIEEDGDTIYVAVDYKDELL